ncbi:MAG: DUF4097 family beta strand repeat-containing protein [Eubacteriales bacterium]|nr:DUF4097 family beta strand repeat-containing protein [Eubacteriales bacterium]
MKKSTICIIILLVVGIACCVAAFSMGIGEVSFDDISAPRFLTYREQAIDKELEPHAEINRLILDIDAAECIVRTGDENSLTAGKDVTWKLEGETLTVSQDKRDGWWWKSKSAPVTLTIRKDGLSDLDIDVDAGAVTVSDLTVTQRITCNVDAGAVEMTDVFAGNLELDVDAGAIAYSGKLVGPAKLECDAGSIDLTLQEGSTIGHVNGSVDAGQIDVTVNGKEAISQDGFSETVSANLPGAIGNDLLTFDCDVGSISVDLIAKEIQ